MLCSWPILIAIGEKANLQPFAPTHSTTMLDGSPESYTHAGCYRAISGWPLTSGGSRQAKHGYLDPLEPQGAVTEQILLNQTGWHSYD